MSSRLRLREVFGVTPLRLTFGDVCYAARGDPTAPRTRFGLSSLRILKPWISIPTWLGMRRRDRRVPIYNFFNRVPAPKDEGYSVRVTYARDWRGGRYTYDSHLGTDFAVPVGTAVVAAAAGQVVRVANDYDRGGLKVCLDHGRGLFSTSNHLSRVLVRVGQRVGRGQSIALSGASGIEFLIGFPWVAPHLHYNVWLNGEPVDPFAIDEEVPLWRGGRHPTPGGSAADGEVEPTQWRVDAVEASIAACSNPRFRARMEAVEGVAHRAAEVLVQRNYRPASFTDFPELYPQRFPREARLDLPFRGEDFAGVAYPGFPVD